MVHQSASFMMKKPRNPFNAMEQAEDLAIQAQENLKVLGYGQEIRPLRLPNKRGAAGLLFACLASIIYGISGFVNGLSEIGAAESSDFILSALDGLSIGALLSGAIAFIFLTLGVFKRYAVKATSISGFIVLLTAPIVLHILGTAFGLLLH